MTTPIRASLACLLLTGMAGLIGLTGCSRPRPDAGPPVMPAPGPAAPDMPAAVPSLPAPTGIDGYKLQVARHIAAHDPARIYMGTLPPLLPAIVVLRITVDRDGRLEHVTVERSRNPQAASIALAAVRRSAPLPPPQALARAHGKITFSETFLFADADRYQLRSLAGPQASE